MTVVLGQYGASGDAGWTTIIGSGTPQDGFNTGAPAASTTMIIHVSSSTGKDSGDGGFNANIQGSSAQPYRTIAAGKAKMRANSPDWLLLMKGDEWNETFGQITFYGISADEPAVVSSYDPSNPNTPNPSTGGARPLLKVDDTVAGGNEVLFASGSAPNGMKFGAIMGIEVYFYKRDAQNNPAQYDPSELGVPTFRVLNAIQWLLIEDCKITYGVGGIVPQPFKLFCYNVIVRRNIVANSWAIYPHGPTAIYSESIVSGFVVEENLLDNNGWNSYLSTPSSVSISVGSPAVVTWTGNFLPTTDIDTRVVFASTGGGITAGIPYYVFSNNGTTFNISTTPTVPTLVNTTGAVVSPQNITWIDTAQSHLNHNTYFEDGSKNVFFTVTAANATIGAVYTDSASTQFVVQKTITGGTTLTTTVGSVIEPSASSGTLTKQSGTGDATITYSNFSAPSFMGDVTVRGNISTNASNNGVQVRSSGLIYDNYVDSCANGITFGNWSSGVSSCYNNVVMGSMDFIHDAAQTPNGQFVALGWGLTFQTTDGAGFEFTNVSGANITGNIFAHLNSITGTNGAAFHIYDQQTNVSATDNIIVDWVNNGYDPGGGGGVVSQGIWDQNGTNTISGNIYQSTNPVPGDHGWPDPRRTAATYDATLGGPGTLTDFISRAKLQSRSSWNTALTAAAVNTYVRQGFGLDIVVPQSVLLGQAML